MNIYYNENNRYAAAWLRNLIAAGHIAPGDVDERSIKDVRAADLDGFTQCHFFAGIGGWSYALRLAGWPDDRLVWTGSCPCQPWSTAGKGGGFSDPRHLWPDWFRLIAECRPSVVFGEQVASKPGLAWFDVVSDDLERKGYAVGAADLCAAGLGAPHIRQRLFFVADRARGGCGVERDAMVARSGGYVDGGCVVGPVADASHRDWRRGERGAQAGAGQDGERRGRSPGGRVVGMADPVRTGIRDCGPGPDAGPSGGVQGEGLQRERIWPDLGDAGGVGAWSDCVWIPCRDGKARPVEPGTFPLAHGIPGRVGRLRAYGNAIVPQVAAKFVAAVMAGP